MEFITRQTVYDICNDIAQNTDDVVVAATCCKIIKQVAEFDGIPREWRLDPQIAQKYYDGMKDAIKISYSK